VKLWTVNRTLNKKPLKAAKVGTTGPTVMAKEQKKKNEFSLIWGYTRVFQEGEDAATTIGK
jgi:hypothetical protein